MKILKLITLMLLATNLTFAQVTYYGTNAGQGGVNSSNYGKEAGRFATGKDNVYIGALAGKTALTGQNNVGIGYAALLKTNNQNNVAIGFASGIDNDTGADNVFLGAHSGKRNISGSSNVYLGPVAGTNNTTGQGNIAIGRAAGGAMTNGNYNVFIGHNAGNGPDSVSNKLYIQSSHIKENDSPLIYGDFATGQVGIGTNHIPTDVDTNMPYTLAVSGKAIIEEVQVMTRDTWYWPDYVFADDYYLTPLNDLEAQIETLGHLPGVPSAEEVETNGHALGRMDAILLEKIEELTLHLIDMNKEIKDLRKENTTLKSEVKALETRNK